MHCNAWYISMNRKPALSRPAHRGSPGGGSSSQSGAGSCWVHGAIFWYIKCSIQIINIHQRIQVLGLRRWQDIGLDAINFTQLEIREDGMFSLIMVVFIHHLYSASNQKLLHNTSCMCITVRAFKQTQLMEDAQWRTHRGWFSFTPCIG